jgi:hypothetical protein
MTQNNPLGYKLIPFNYIKNSKNFSHLYLNVDSKKLNYLNKIINDFSYIFSIKLSMIWFISAITCKIMSRDIKLS